MGKYNDSYINIYICLAFKVSIEELKQIPSLQQIFAKYDGNLESLELENEIYNQLLNDGFMLQRSHKGINSVDEIYVGVQLAKTNMQKFTDDQILSTNRISNMFEKTAELYKYTNIEREVDIIVNTSDCLCCS